MSHFVCCNPYWVKDNKVGYDLLERTNAVTRYHVTIYALVTFPIYKLTENACEVTSNARVSKSRPSTVLRELVTWVYYKKRKDGNFSLMYPRNQPFILSCYWQTVALYTSIYTSNTWRANRKLKTDKLKIIWKCFHNGKVTFASRYVKGTQIQIWKLIHMYKLVRAYSKPLLGPTMAHNLVPWVF